MRSVAIIIMASLLAGCGGGPTPAVRDAATVVDDGGAAAGCARDDQCLAFERCLHGACRIPDPGDAGTGRDATVHPDGGSADAEDDAGIDAGGADAGTDGEIDAGAGDAGPADAGGDVGSAPCPPLMALVDDAFCVDLFEGALEEQDGNGAWAPASPYLTVGSRVVRAVPAAGITPQGYISGLEAETACTNAGKRLCSSTEWLAACRGPQDYVYPYGNAHVDGACNDHYPGVHPVSDYFGTGTGVWDTAHMNDPGINQQPDTVAAGGAFTQCVSAWGSFDMHGNLHEWVSDTDGTFRGGFYADAVLNNPGCTYETVRHTSDYHDYSTGFRCCKSRKPAR